MQSDRKSWKEKLKESWKEIFVGAVILQFVLHYFNHAIVAVLAFLFVDSAFFQEIIHSFEWLHDLFNDHHH